MQRILWLPFCLLVTATVATQTNASQYRDDRFNPMNMMSDMGPMNMFDSSDRRRERRRHRLPPPRPAPAFGYGGYPAYARPPVAQPPHAYPRFQQSGRPLPAGAPVQQPAPQTRPETAPTAKGAHAEPPRSQTPDYSFRPVPPSTPAQASGAQTAREEPTMARSYPAPSTRVMKPPMPERGPNEPTLIDGKPAVFRPMEQDPSSQQ